MARVKSIVAGKCDQSHASGLTSELSDTPAYNSALLGLGVRYHNWPYDKKKRYGCCDSTTVDDMEQDEGNKKQNREVISPIFAKGKMLDLWRLYFAMFHSFSAEV